MLFFIFLTYSSVIDINTLKEKKKTEKEKLLSIVRNEDHCEHNAIEKEENQQFDNKLKEEKTNKQTKHSRPTQAFRDRIELCVFLFLSLSPSLF